MKRNIKLIGCFLTILILSGCVIKFKTVDNTDGGVYQTFDQGQTWQQTNTVYRVSEVAENFNNAEVTALVIDPQDPQAVYVGTVDQGIFYSYNGGAGWQQTLAARGKINAIAISPKETCFIYAAIGNRVYKTVDCSRHWDYQLIETQRDPNNLITALAVDPLNSSLVYSATSGKGLFKSLDRGFSWQVVKFFNNPILKILLSPTQAGVIYLATQNQGIFRSDNYGADWRPLLNQSLVEQFPGLLAFRELILDPTNEQGLLYASQHGLFRSADGGAAWQNIKLLTPSNTSVIYSLVINRANGQEIYYGINNALYRTVDGGQNWITRDLPTSRAATFLLLDPKNTQHLYLGVRRVK